MLSEDLAPDTMPGYDGDGNLVELPTEGTLVGMTADEIEQEQQDDNVENALSELEELLKDSEELSEATLMSEGEQIIFADKAFSNKPNVLGVIRSVEFNPSQDGESEEIVIHTLIDDERCVVNYKQFKEVRSYLNFEHGYIHVVYGPSVAADFNEHASTLEEVTADQPHVENEELKEAIRSTDTNPTEEEKETSDYQKGYFIHRGLMINIENPRGSVRSGVSPDGTRWENTLHHHYGEVIGSNGADNDPVDVFVGYHLSSDKVFIIDQVDKEGKFDEHKCMIGFNTEEEALEGYLCNYKPGWDGCAAITEITWDEFYLWIGACDKRSMFSKADIDYERSLEAGGGWTPQPSDKHKGFYEVPNNKYFVVSKSGIVKNAKTGYETTGSPDNQGYMRTAMWDNEKGTKKDIKIHTLICSAFHGPCPADCDEVDHLDNNRANNKASNLRWVSRKDNMAKRHGSLESSFFAW